MMFVFLFYEHRKSCMYFSGDEVMYLISLMTFLLIYSKSRVSILKACLRKSPIAKVCSTNTSLFNSFCYCSTRWELLH